MNGNVSCQGQPEKVTLCALGRSGLLTVLVRLFAPLDPRCKWPHKVTNCEAARRLPETRAIPTCNFSVTKRTVVVERCYEDATEPSTNGHKSRDSIYTVYRTDRHATLFSGNMTLVFFFERKMTPIYNTAL